MKRLSLIFTILLAVGCSQNPMSQEPSKTVGPKPPENSQGNENPDNNPPGPVFQIIKTQVLDGQCLRCHSAAGGNRGDVNLETYANVKSWLFEIEDTVNNNIMPPRRPLPDDLKDLLKKWIELGAPEG